MIALPLIFIKVFEEDNLSLQSLTFSHEIVDFLAVRLPVSGEGFLRLPHSSYSLIQLLIHSYNNK